MYRDPHTDRGLVVLGLLLSAVVLVAGFGTIEHLQIKTYDAAEEGMASWWHDTLPQWLMAVFAILATGAGVWTVLLLRQTLRETKRTADEAVAANRNALRASQTEFRPWLRCDPITVRKIVFHQGLLSVDVVVPLQNLGRSPAVRVRARCKLLRVNNGMIYTPDDDLAKFCRQNLNVIQIGENVSVFPDERHTLYAADSELPGALTVVPPSPAIRLLICVTYRSMVSPDAEYHTGFVAYLHFQYGLPALGDMTVDPGSIRVTDDRGIYDMS